MLSLTCRRLIRSGCLIKPFRIATTIRPLTIHSTLQHLNFSKNEKICFHFNEIPRRWSHVHYTYPMIESRVMLVLRLFDKIDPNQLKLDSKFIQDLGLDSLDIVEITAALEDEFWTEIPDVDSDHFLTPRHIIQYLADKYDVYEHIEPISAGKEYLEDAKKAAERAHH